MPRESSLETMLDTTPHLKPGFNLHVRPEFRPDCQHWNHMICNCSVPQIETAWCNTGIAWCFGWEIPTSTINNEDTDWYYVITSIINCLSLCFILIWPLWTYSAPISFHMFNLVVTWRSIDQLRLEPRLWEASLHNTVCIANTIMMITWLSGNHAVCDSALLFWFIFIIGLVYVTYLVIGLINRISTLDTVTL
jgi:hypothetical protein